jgi:SOS-response transcriptional repressor LexA
MSDSRPSKKQRELLSFIDGFIKGNGYGPSYREVMRALDYKSVSTVAVHIDGLIARGLLLKKDNSARSLEVVTDIDSIVPETDKSAHGDWLNKEIMKRTRQLETKDDEVLRQESATLKEAARILGFELTN